MAEVGSLTARAKMAIKIFVWRAFAIPVTDASFWCIIAKGWLAIAKLIPLSLFISLLLMPNEAFDNVKIEK